MMILVSVIVVLLMALAILIRDRFEKLYQRRCHSCNSWNVERTFKMFPIIRAREREGFEHPQISPDRRWFTVYKFGHCQLCDRLTLQESVDKPFTLESLRHKLHGQPTAFVYDQRLFKQAGLKPCDFLDLQFDPHKELGEPNWREKIGLVHA